MSYVIVINIDDIEYNMYMLKGCIVKYIGIYI